MLGSRLGRWVLDQELGRGGMGQVYLAHDAATGERAAVKVLAPDLAPDPGSAQRFQREIDVLGQLEHPNIVRFYEAGSQDGKSFYAMEYVEGKTYDDLLIDQGQLPWADVLDLALQICPALKHAHDRGIVHRDLKPSNLLRQADGLVKLTDFGIAQVFAGTHLTATGVVVGTGDFLSPEQAAGKQATKRSDLYSLGVVLYTLLTGRTPFQGESVLDLMHKHRYAQFEKPRRLVPDIPPEIEEVVCRLMEKDPDNRPADAGVLHKLLEGVRRKLARRDLPTALQASTRAERARPAGAEGPATTMARLMREELESQNRGGPVQQFLNRPLVLVVLLLLCVGGIAWAFWPDSAEGLFRKGEALMQSENPGDWDYAWRKYFEPLQQKYPDHSYGEQLAKYRQQIDDQAAFGDANRVASSAKIGSEAQWFYLKGLRRRQQGDEPGARRIWSELASAFRDVKAEQPWVRLAEKELEKPSERAVGGDKRWATAKAALERARQLRDEGERAKAEEIWQGLEELYKADPSAKDVLDELRRDRAK